ncbi:MAG TPA: ABC transporter permease [Acidobacteriaceae bacterium]|nr:ABC transporter permease [Acidobacteriaceae bacterium]
MTDTTGFLRKLWMLIRRERFRDELDEEMAFHRAQTEKEFAEGGMTKKEARQAAARQFGNAESLKERSSEVVGFRFETVLQDLRYAARQLMLNPGFTAVITLTLALSIGANSAIFSVIDAVLLKSLPYPEPDKLMRLFLSNSEYPQFPLNPFDFRDFRARNRSFESMAAYTRGDLQLSGSGDPVKLNGFAVTSGYFHVLGLQPRLGREFDYQAELPGNGLQVILSDGLWRTKFGADPKIVGRKITLDLEPYTVIGVMPPGTEHPGNDYHALPFGDSVDVWSPFTFAGNPTERGSHYIEGIGRLKSGVTTEQAKSEMNAIMAQLGREHEGDRNWSVLVMPLYQDVVGANRTMLLVLLGAVGMVLLIACANAANLLLARAAARQREVAVRLALGAQRSRLIRQMLTESLLISLLGGGLGVLLAIEGVQVLVSLLPAGFPRASEIHVNAPVLLFTLLISVVTGILFGVAPALQASRTDPSRALHEGGRGATGSGRQKKLRSLLVISEVSLACVLLIGAGLMLRSFLNLMHLDPGFRQDHALTASLSLPQTRYKSPTDITGFYNRLVSGINSIPGVQSTGIGSDLPWTGYDENAGGFTIEGKQPPPHSEFHARYHWASQDYFRSLGIPLIHGRFFNQAEASFNNSPRVLIINKALAQRYWPGEDVVGKRITFDDHPKDSDWMTIVGEVGDVKDKPNSAGAEPAFWWPPRQRLDPDMYLVVRSNADPQSLIGAVREQVKSLDPSLAVADIRLMDTIADQGIATPRFAFLLVGLFAGLAIVLAAIGTYGVISYSVSQRIPEFGLRLALGAPPSGLLRLVLAQAAWLAIAGTVLGVGVALTLARVMRSLIYDVSPADPLTFASVGLMVIAIALLACYLPARRATKANPMVALRAE